MSWELALRVPVGDGRIELACGPSPVLVLAGANGVGKTTVLRAVLGLSDCEGTVRVHGATWQDGSAGLRPEQRRSGYAPQGAGLFSGHSVRRNVMAALRGANRGSRATDLLARYGLGALSAQPAQTLSRGEQQQVALVRALAAVADGATALVLDEPFAHVSDEARPSLEAGIMAAVAGGAALLLVTHDDAFATRLGGERVVVTRSPRARRAAR